MKRYALALLLHPYKNGIMQHSVIRASMTVFIEMLCSLLQRFPQIRFNIVIPAYILECADPLLTVKLRDLCKRSLVEIVCTGYTEPFLSLSPAQLTIKNIQHGMHVIEELTGQVPRGFLPPFSNWEPSFIEHLRSAGFRYVLLSNELFSPETHAVPGYWVAEHTGSSIGLIGTNVLSNASIQNGFFDSVRSFFTYESTSVPDPFAVLHYLMPLQTEKIDEACGNVLYMVEEIDKHLLQYQPVCLGELLSTVNPVGMQYVPTSLQLERRGAVDLHFMNYLFSFDQIGFMQRKLLDIYERLTPYLSEKSAVPLLKELFLAQDINRLHPGRESGFERAADRAVTYRRLIAIDTQLRHLSKNSGVRTRITDFLHNGGKAIILSNKNLKAVIDPQIGGQITGLDFRPRHVNLCAMYNPTRRTHPDIIVSGTSRTLFLDRIVNDSPADQLDSTHLYNDSSNLGKRTMDYKIRKNGGGITVSMMHAGSFMCDDKPQPLAVEKVLGLEEEQSDISFVYQFSNPSLLQYSFIFTTELNLFLPGITADQVFLHAGKSNYTSPGRQLLRLPDLTSWYIDDPVSGIRITLQTQKPLTLWTVPPPDDSHADGVTLMLSTPVAMEPSSRFKIIGKLSFKPLNVQTGPEDAF